jgi:4-hydroxybenzoate polyprenyltransferase
MYQVPTWPAARSILLIAFVGLCAGSYGHIINDVFDIEVDRNAGKRNHMAAFAPWQRFGLCALTLALGFLPALFVPFSRTSLLLLAVEFLLPTIYSVPPIRLKGRGALGLFCDSFGAHLIPCLYVISVLAHQTSDAALLHTRSSVAFVSCTAVWALFLGLIGILIHEFEDRDNDIRSGIVTFATGTEFSRVRGAMTIFYVIELCAFAGLLVALFRSAPLVVVTAIVFTAAIAIRLSAHWHHYRHYSRDATAIQWWQLSHAFYEAYLPVTAAIQCAWFHPALSPFPILQLVIFAPTFRQQATEMLEVARHAIAWIAYGGRLDVDPNANAFAWPLRLFPRLGTRVRIQEPGSDPWNIRITHPGLKVASGGVYRVKFKVRADRSRNIKFGVWQDHEPWQNLGFCEDFAVTSEWKSIWRRFTATGDDRHGYFGFWMGGEPGSVDIRLCSVRPAHRSGKIG